MFLYIILRRSTITLGNVFVAAGGFILGLGLSSLLFPDVRAYAAAPCAAACAPFKGSPGTYDTCCKQHAANAPKPVLTSRFKPAPVPKPAVLTSRFKTAPAPKPTVQKVSSGLGNPSLSEKLGTLHGYGIPSGRSSTKQSCQDMGGAVVCNGQCYYACKPGSVFDPSTCQCTHAGQNATGGPGLRITTPSSIAGRGTIGWNLDEGEKHFRGGPPKGAPAHNYREAWSQPMISNSAGVSMIVQMPANTQTHDELTPTIGGPPHSGGDENYTGYKFRIQYGPNASGGPVYTDENRHNYTQPTQGVTKTRDYKDTDVLLPGGKYGIIVTKKNNSDGTVDLGLWYQDFSKEASPRNVMNVHDDGSFGHKPFTGDDSGDPITAQGKNIIDIRRDYAQHQRSVTDIVQFPL